MTFEELNRTVESMYKRLNDLETRFDKAGVNANFTRPYLDSLEGNMRELNDRVDCVENAMETQQISIDLLTKSATKKDEQNESVIAFANEIIDKLIDKL